MVSIALPTAAKQDEILQKVTGSYGVDLFNKAGVFEWTPPEGVGKVFVTIGGTGGGGGAGVNASNINYVNPGTGGGGGSLILDAEILIEPLTPITITVGAGGAGGLISPIDTNGGTGGAGEITSFGRYLSLAGAKGGVGGIHYYNNTNVLGGSPITPSLPNGITAPYTLIGKPGGSVYMVYSSGYPYRTGSAGSSLMANGGPGSYSSSESIGPKTCELIQFLGWIGGKGGSGGYKNVPPTEGSWMSGGGGGSAGQGSTDLSRAGAKGGSGFILVRW